MDMDLVAEFINESRELLEGIEPQLIEMHQSVQAKGDYSPEQLNDVFRLFHSLKGTAGFLGLEQVISVSHRAESLLDKLRSKEFSLLADHTTAMCGACDVIYLLLESIERTGTDLGHEEQVTRMAELFDLLLEGKGTSELTEPTRVLTSVQTEEPPAEAETVVADPPLVDETHVPTQATTADGQTVRKSNETLRVDVARLDELNNLVGELVISESMLNRQVADLALEESGLDKTLMELTRVVNQMRDLAIHIRMVPVGGQFRRLIRLVHELGRASGKQVDIIIRGEDTEIDKTVLELIMDPIVHIIRNAVDHGVESPEVRKEAGKPITGRILLDAYQRGGNVWICISDDGKGLNRDSIIHRAKEAGLLAGDGKELGPQDIADLLCTPGFSTAEEITDISGRGVGMDVVKRNIEKIQGGLDIQSVQGQGCAVSVRIPLTLSIIQGMIVMVGTEEYILPLQSIAKALRPDDGMLSTVGASDELVNWQGSVLPLVRLGRVFDVPNCAERLSDGHLLLVEDAGQLIAVLVDSLVAQSQFVVKPVNPLIGGAGGFSSATTNSSGDVSLIVEPSGLLKLRESFQDVGKIA